MKTIRLQRKGELCALEIQVKASKAELEDEAAERIRKYLTTQQEWTEIRIARG